MTRRPIISEEIVGKVRDKISYLETSLDDLLYEAEKANEYILHLSKFEEEDGNKIADDIYVEYWHCDTDTSTEYLKLIDLLRDELEDWGDQENYAEEVKSGIEKSDLDFWDPATRAQCERLRFLNIMLVRAYDDWERRFKNLSDEEMKTAKLFSVDSE